MSWWSTIIGFFTGGGGIVSAVDDVAKVVVQGEQLAHDHNENVAGQDKILATDNAEKAKINEQVAQAAVDTTDAVALNKLRDGSA